MKAIESVVSFVHSPREETESRDWGSISAGNHEVEDPPHSWIFKSRGWMGSFLLVPIGIAVSFSFPMIKEDSLLDLLMDFLGWGLFLTYIAFRLWATLYVGGRKDKQLQTEGPYSITRNPLYFGNLCFALSLPCFFDSISILGAVLLTTILCLSFVIRDEEVYLENKFGEEFREYCQRTSRLFPNFFQYSQSKAFIDVNLRSMKTEAKRLCCASLVPISAEIIMYLRGTLWWPHWFTLP